MADTQEEACECCVRDLSVSMAAMLELLIRKGVTTMDEFERTRIGTQAEADQMDAEERDGGPGLSYYGAEVHLEDSPDA